MSERTSHFPFSRPAAVNMALAQLYTNDIHDPRILQAMVDVPREPFLPEHLRGAAYVDEDIGFENGRYYMASLTLARLIELAGITPMSRVLVIGCLNGYAAAIVAKLAGHVVATDLIEPLLARADGHMQRLGIRNVDLRHVTSLADGFPPSAPYDAIIVHGAVEFIPEALGAQLAIGGKLTVVRNVATRPGIPCGLGKGLMVTRFDHRLQYREYFDAAAALLPGFERADGFVF